RTRPVRIGREGVRVQMRGHVAGRAGVGVVAPGAADIVAALEHQIIGAPLLLKRDRQAEAGEPAADDDGPDVPGPALSVVGSGSGRGKVGTHVGGSCHDSTRFDGSRYDSIVCNFATHITETRALLSPSQQLLSIVQYARGVSTRDRTPKRTRLSPEERRSQLIALGVKMLGERTPEEISISEIAAQAGISRGLLFHYFPTKQDFLLAVVQHANTDLLDRITPDPTVDVLTMLRDSIRRYIDYVAENRTSYRALLRGPTSVSPDLRPLVDSTREAVIGLILTELPLDLPEARLTRLRLGLRGWVAFVEETTL